LCGGEFAAGGRMPAGMRASPPGKAAPREAAPREAAPREAGSTGEREHSCDRAAQLSTARAALRLREDAALKKAVTRVVT
jgi:hypothetical protein